MLRSGSLLIEFLFSLMLSSLLCMLFVPIISLYQINTHTYEQRFLELSLHRAVHQILQEIAATTPVERVECTTSNTCSWDYRTIKGKVNRITVRQKNNQLIIEKEGSSMVLMPTIETVTFFNHHIVPTCRYITIHITKSGMSTQATYPFFMVTR